MIKKTINYIKDENNSVYLFYLIIVFIIITKLPAIFLVDIQPWDEGMYATRVLSIHLNGDFIDQTYHSIGKFYSGSHPPLLIWAGWISTTLFGLNSPALKIIPFICSLLCLVLLFKIGKSLHNSKTGLFAVMIFSSNIIFAVFSKRFQFDFPYTFLILFAFYLFLIYNETREKKYIYYIGIIFGACLMIKILVGVFIPLVLLASLLFIKKNNYLSIYDLLIISAIGIIIAIPWHLYMILKYGEDFLKWFFGYHIYERAFSGLEHNNKNSGVLYHINYLFSIIPYSSLLILAFLKDVINIKNLDFKKLFVWVWFLIGFVIITSFKTKLEVYILLILAQVCLVIPVYIDQLKDSSMTEKILSAIFVIFNIFWAFTFEKRDGIKLFFLNNLVISVTIIFAVFILLYFIIQYICNSINFHKLYLSFIIIFFLCLNIVQMINIPWWENTFNITPLSKTIGPSNPDKIIYIGANYRANPQFSFYYKGLDLGWKVENSDYKLLLTRKENILDTINKDYDYHNYILRRGINEVKYYLDSLNDNNYSIIVERDEINRTDYDSIALFIPDKYKNILKVPGYELYKLK